MSNIEKKKRRRSSFANFHARQLSVEGSSSITNVEPLEPVEAKPLESGLKVSSEAGPSDSDEYIKCLQAESKEWRSLYSAMKKKLMLQKKNRSKKSQLDLASCEIAVETFPEEFQEFLLELKEAKRDYEMIKSKVSSIKDMALTIISDHEIKCEKAQSVLKMASTNCLEIESKLCCSIDTIEQQSVIEKLLISEIKSNGTNEESFLNFNYDIQ